MKVADTLLPWLISAHFETCQRPFRASNARFATLRSPFRPAPPRHSPLNNPPRPLEISPSPPLRPQVNAKGPQISNTPGSSADFAQIPQASVAATIRPHLPLLRT